MTSDTSITRISTCSDLLSQHTKIHILSCGLTIGVMISTFTMAILRFLDGIWLAVTWVVMIAGIMETLLAVRIGFDAALLQRLTQQKSITEKELDALDQNLSSLNLMPEKKRGRTLDARLNGCLALLKKQVFWTGVQLITVIGAATWAAMAPIIIV